MNAGVSIGPIPLRPWWRVVRRILPSTLEVLTGIACAVALLRLEIPSELWLQLSSGRWTVAQLHVPQSNLFSFTAPEHPWTNHQWLTDVLVFQVYDLLGARWWLLAQSLLFALDTGVLYKLLRRRGGVVPAVGLTVAAMSACFLSLEHTPHLLSCLLLTVLLWWLMDREGVASPIWILLPPLFWIWANLHGSFLIGLGVFGSVVLGNLRDASVHKEARVWPIQLLALALAALFSLWTPYYVGLYQVGLEDFWQLMTSAPFRLRFLPSLHAAIMLCAALLSWLLIASTGPHIRWRLVLPLLALTPLAFLNPDYLALWAVMAAVTWMEHFQLLMFRIRHEGQGVFGATRGLSALLRRGGEALRPLSTWDRAVPGGVGLALMMTGLLGIFSIPAGVEGRVFGVTVQGIDLARRIEASGMPVQAALHLTASALGETRVLTPVEWGSYLIWVGEPDVRVFIDARENAYPLEAIEDYDRVAESLPGWEEVLERHRVDFILWQAEAFQARALLSSGGWRVAWQDDATVLLARESSRPPAPDAASELAYEPIPEAEGASGQGPVFDESALPGAPPGASADEKPVAPDAGHLEQVDAELEPTDPGTDFLDAGSASSQGQAGDPDTPPLGDARSGPLPPESSAPRAWPTPRAIPGWEEEAMFRPNRAVVRTR